MKCSLILFFTLTILCSFSQEIKNFSLKNDTVSILYIGIENQILVEGLDTTKNIRLKSNSFHIEKSSVNTFIVKATNETADSLKVLQDNLLLISKTYKPRHVELEGMYPTFANYTHNINSTNYSFKGNLTLNNIRQNSDFQYKDNTLLKNFFDIISFDFLLSKSNEDVIYKTAGITGTSVYFKSTLNRAEVNDVLIFENIKVKNLKTGEIRKIPSQTYTITE